MTTREQLIEQMRLAVDLWKDCKCDPWCNSQTSACEFIAFRRCKELRRKGNKEAT